MARTKRASGKRLRGSSTEQTRYEDDDDEDRDRLWDIHSIEYVQVRVKGKKLDYEFRVAWVGWAPTDNSFLRRDAFSDTSFVDEWFDGVNWKGRDPRDPRAFKDKEKFFRYNPGSEVEKDRRPPSIEREHPYNTKETPFCVGFSDDDGDGEDLPSPSEVFGTRRKAPSRDTTPEDQNGAGSSHAKNDGSPNKRRRMNTASSNATSSRSSARLAAQSRFDENEPGELHSMRVLPPTNDHSGDSFEADAVSAQLRPLSRATSVGSSHAYTHPHTTNNEDSDTDAEHDKEQINNDSQEAFLPDTRSAAEFTQAEEDERDSVMGSPEPDSRADPARSLSIPEYTRASPPAHVAHVVDGTFMRELQSPEYEESSFDRTDERYTLKPPTSLDPPQVDRESSIKTEPSPYSTPPPRTPGPAHDTPASAASFRATPFGHSVVVSMNGNVPHRVLFASSGRKSKALAQARRSSMIASPLPVCASIVPALKTALIIEPEPVPQPEPVTATHVEENAQDLPVSTPTPAPSQPVGVRLALKRKLRDGTDALLAGSLQAAVRKGQGLKPRLSATESAYFSNKSKGPSRLREGGNMSV